MNPNNRLVISALMLCVLSIGSDAQMNSPCSPRMLSSVSGCMSFATGNGNSPTSDCCKALKSLTGTAMDCLCLIVTANVPINLPINRTLAISLPRACGMPGVPLQCKASAAPLPAPGPMSLLAPTISPTDSQTPKKPDSVRPTTPSATSLNPTDKDPESDEEGEPPSVPPNNSSASFSTNYPKLSFILFAFVFEIIIKFF